MEFPKNDKELRMYCLGLASENELNSGRIDMDEAEKYYNFITASSKSSAQMSSIKLANIPTPIPADRVIDLLFELRCSYHELATAAKTYNEMENSVHNGDFSSPSMAQAILDGAHEAREAEVAHIRDRIFILLRNFFEPLEHDPSE